MGTIAEPIGSGRPWASSGRAGTAPGWGIVDDERRVCGNILTGFHPKPTSVVFLLSARVVNGNRLSMDSLETLFAQVDIRSLPTASGMLIQDRGVAVFTSASRHAVSRCQELVRHLVGGAAAVRTVAVDASQAMPMRVRWEGDSVSDAQEFGERTPERGLGWVDITDWEERP